MELMVVLVVGVSVKKINKLDLYFINEIESNWIRMGRERGKRVSEERQ